MRQINNLIIHCSDSYFGDADLINEWHTKQGWKTIGYHYVILNGRRKTSKKYDFMDDGRLETGRSEEEIGAHVQGANADSIGICLISGGDGEFTVPQVLRLIELLKTLMVKYKLTPDAIKGHREFPSGAKKECPGFDVENLRRWLVNDAANANIYHPGDVRGHA